MSAGRLSLLCVVFVLALPVSSAAADAFTVTTTADTTNGSCATTCSLRDAVIAANASNATADVITVPAGTYRLTQGTTLDVGSLTSNDLTINGAGARSTTIEGTGAERLITAGQPLTGVTLTLDGLRLTGGNAALGATVGPGSGGAVYLQDGSLNVTRSAVVANTAATSGAGIGVAHTGGAGTVTITASQISGNTVGGAASPGTASGGGIFSQYTVNLVNSTVSGNVAQTTVQAQGGGIAMLGGTLSLVNSTVAGNAARGSGTSLGGGIVPVGASTATNAIVAGNVLGAGGADVPSDCSTAFTGTLANNISSDASCGFTAANGGKPNTDPQLGALLDNGGPTDTRKPALASPALNAGTPTGCPGQDQRGVTRPEGTACDIGAVENAPPTIATGAATGVRTTEAVLTAQVRNPLVQAAVVGFQFGRTTAYGRSVQATGIPAQTTATASARVTALTSGAEWHYRPIVVNGDGFALGQDRAFRTLSAGRKPFLKVTGLPKSCRRSPFGLRLRSKVSGSGVKLRSVRVTLNGRKLKTVTRAGRFRLRINARKLKAGKKYTVRVNATDSTGRATTFKKSFKRCKAKKRSPKKR